MEQKEWKPAQREQSVAYLKEDDMIVRGYRHSEIVENMTFTEAFFLTLRGRLPKPDETKVLDACLNGLLAYELWTITAIVAPARPQEAYSAFEASYKMGGNYAMFPQHCAELILESYDLMKKENIDIKEAAVRVVKKCKEERRIIPGLGHDIFKKVDPRSAAVRKVAEKYGFVGEKTLLFEAIHAEFIKTSPKLANMCINIDGMLACIYLELGFKPVELSVMAMLTLAPGCLAHIVEQGQKRMSFDLGVLKTKYTGKIETDLPPEFKRS